MLCYCSSKMIIARNKMRQAYYANHKIGLRMKSNNLHE